MSRRFPAAASSGRPLALWIGSAVLVSAPAIGAVGFARAGEAEAATSFAQPFYAVGSAVSTPLFEPGRQVWKGGLRDRPEISLTFDDGPHPSSPRILDALKRHKIRATFFVVGRVVERRPEQVRRMLAEGHEVGNHTYDHKRLDGLSPAQIESELAACEAAVRRAAGVRITLMRPPGMRLSDAVIAANRALGYTLVDWTIGAKDFIGNVPRADLPPSLAGQPDATPALVRERVARQLRNGAIILLHDNRVTAAALPGILDDILARGYRIRTVSEMMAALPQGVRVVANPPISSPGASSAPASPGAPSRTALSRR